MIPTYINLAVEDDLSEAVLRRILEKSGCNYQVHICYGKRGISYLHKNIAAYNNAAKSVPYLVLIDLDREECPPSIIQRWFDRPPHPHLLFRIAVHEVEAWLLADCEGIANYLAILQISIPGNVEEIIDPKQMLINLARKSRMKNRREAIVPPSGSTRKQGADYNGAMIGFVKQRWNIDRARKKSASLQKTIDAIKNLYCSISE